MVDLSQFCGGQHDLPFSQGEWTYATNRHIMVRVPRREGVADGGPNIQRLLNAAGPLPSVFPLSVKVPKITTEDCGRCDGRGTRHDCPSCECECAECGGNGKRVTKYSVGIGDAFYDGKYIAMLLRLPDIRVPTNPPREQAMRFAFDGGEGWLMPLAGKRETHVKAKLGGGATTGEGQ